MTVVGELALWVALFLAIWGSVASFGGATTGRRELVASGVRALVVGAGMTVLACLGVWGALVGHDFSLQYVASHTTLNTPTLYLVTALWAGPPGAMLSFALALLVGSAIALGSRRRSQDARVPWVAGAVAAVVAFVLVGVCFVTNPYDRLEWVPGDGQGLDPRLQSPLAAPYYAATYAGFGTAVVPFALAVAAAVTRDVDAGLLASLRRWSLATWLLLTTSLAIRMRWTYLHPLAAGFWDAGAAVVATGGAWLLGFLILRSFGARAGAPPPRRVATLALAVFALTLAAAAVGPGPPGPRVAAGAGSFQTSASLLGFAILAAILIHWTAQRLPPVGGRTEPRRPASRAGEAAAYLGAALLVAGLAATRWWSDNQVTLRPGASAALTDPYGRRWRFVSQGVSRDEGINYMSTGVALEAWRGGKSVGIVSAERRQYLDAAQRTTSEPVLRPGVRSSFVLDVYTALGGVTDEAARLRVDFRPLVACVWLGWVVVAAGGVLLGIGGARPRGARAAGAEAAAG